MPPRDLDGVDASPGGRSTPPPWHIDAVEGRPHHQGHSQAEIDGLWDALLEGGAPEQCGWLRDQRRLCWQITPRRLGELIRDPDRQEARRVTEAMLGMVKLDVAALEAAARGAA